MQHVDEEDLNERNTSILNKVYIKYVSQSSQISYIIWDVGGIYSVKRTDDGNTRLNIDDLDERTVRTKIKNKDKNKKLRTEKGTEKKDHKILPVRLYGFGIINFTKFGYGFSFGSLKKKRPEAVFDSNFGSVLVLVIYTTFYN